MFIRSVYDDSIVVIFVVDDDHVVVDDDDDHVVVVDDDDDDTTDAIDEVLSIHDFSKRKDFFTSKFTMHLVKNKITDV